MAETSLGSIPENLSITDVYTTATVNPLPAMLVGRRALYDELIWDAEGGFATAWEAKSSLVDAGDGYFYFKLQRQAFSAAGLALFVNGDATASGGSPSGPAGGDLGGTYPNPDVTKLQGQPVSTTDPITGQSLVFNGTQWAPASTSPASAQYVTLATDGALTNERVLTAGAGITRTDAGAGSTVTLAQNRPWTNTNSTAFTPALTDAFRTFNFQQAASVVTLPTNAAVPFPIGTAMWFVQGSATATPSPGQLTVVGDVGVTLTGYSGKQFGASRGPGGTICVIKSATDTWVSLPGNGIKGENSLMPTSNKTADYSLALPDQDTFNIVNAASAVTVTVPDFASVAFPAGAVIGVYQLGAGQVILSPAPGVSLQTPTGRLPRTRGQFSIIYLKKLSTSSNNIWTVEGDLETTVPFLTFGNTTALASERSLLQGAGLLFTDAGAGNSLTVAQNIPFQATASTAYTFVLGDAFRRIAAAVGAPATYTIPDDATTNFPVGTEIYVNWNGNPPNYITFVGGAGVTLRTPAGFSAVTQNRFGVTRLYKSAANEWYADGNLQESTSYVTLAATATQLNERVLTAGAGISITDGGAGGAVTVAQNIPLNTQGGTAYTLVLADAGKMVNTSSVTAVTLTIPNTSTVNFPVGTEILVRQGAAGKVAIVGAGGVVLSMPPAKNASTVGLNSIVSLRHLAANAWGLSDDLEDSTQYLTLAATAGHPNERVLNAGTGISFTDGGAGSTLTINATGVAPTTAQYVTLATDGTLTNERVLTAGAGITITDGGAGGAVTVAFNGTPYKARALGSGQAIATGTQTVLTLPTESYDPNSNFASDAYTAPVTGYYQYDGYLGMTLSAPTTPVLQLTKNSVSVSDVHMATANSTFAAGANTGQFLLNAGEVIRLELTPLGGGITASVFQARLSIHLLST